MCDMRANDFQMQDTGVLYYIAQGLLADSPSTTLFRPLVNIPQSTNHFLNLTRNLKKRRLALEIKQTHLHLIT